MRETMLPWMRLTIWLSLLATGVLVFWIRDCNHAPRDMTDPGRGWAADCARACAYAGRTMQRAVRSAGPDECTCEPSPMAQRPDGGP